MTFELGWPLALWGLIALPCLPLLARKSRFPISAPRLRAVMALRALAVALAVFSVADARVGSWTSNLAVGLVVDGTTSVAPEERSRIARELEALRATHDDVAWTLVSSQAGSNDLERDVGAAVALLPRDRVRRLLVATDGRDPRLAASLASARNAGVEVALLPVGERPTLDTFSVVGLSAPRLLRAEERTDIEVRVFASRDGDVVVEASFDGRPAVSEPHRASRGTSTARLTVQYPDAPGIHVLEVAVRGPGDAVAANDRWRALVEVLPKPRVRILRDPGGESVLATVLREAAMEVDVAPPQRAFPGIEDYEPYALVVADEIELGDLSEEQQTALRRWVEERGGGLVTVTFDHPVRRTPRILREIEPVLPPPALPEPRPLELVIVIDRSGSMQGLPMVQARQAAIDAVRSLRPDARVGAVAFSGAADRVMPPVPMDQADRVVEFISGIHADGGTNIAAAISAANQIMSSDPRYIHHVILISDGESEPRSAIAAAMSLAGRGVSISTITIGSYSQLLAEIARIGRGRYHVTSGSGLRSLVVSEAMMRQPPAHRQTPFVLREATHLPMFDGLSFAGAPPLGGHALAGLRPGATQVLTASEGMPLLAHWHRGNGQVATWTSATSGSWADGLRRSPLFRQIFTRLARAMLRTRTPDPPRIVVERDPLSADRRLLTVVSVGTDERVLPVVRLFRDATVATLGSLNRAANGEPLEMATVGPGVLQASVPVGSGFLVDARMPNDVEPTAAAGDERPYDEELATFGPDPAALERLAAIGGGSVLATPADVLATPAPVAAMRSLRTPLLVLALLSYLVSLLLLRLPDRALASSVALERPSRVPNPSRRSVPPRASDTNESRAA